MKRIQYHRYGGPEEMHLETHELAALGKDEILVRIKAASINPFDWKVRQGTMKMFVRGKFPRGMGTDFAGVVEAVGANISRLRIGDEVLGTGPLAGGAFGEQVVTKEKLVIKKPEALSFEQTAALPNVAVTAWKALVLKGHLKAGQAVFVNGALGGVGEAAVYIAKAMGASVAGRVGPNALDEAKTIGVDPVLEYTKPIPSSLSGRFDVVFDTNGSLSIAEGNALARSKGIVVDTNPTGAKFMKSLFSSRRQFVLGTPDISILQKIVDLASSGKLPLTIGRTAPLAEAIALISDLEAGRRTKGKAVIVIG
jgi:NADPH:quinone reductase-like Zn-dependent oxidoreductase